jgi:rhomboid protease GluP
VLEERDYEFLQALWNRRVRITYIFFAINILIFILMEFAGGTTNEATLLAFGVKSNPEINHGEIWRLVTPIFIHIGLLHLFFNSYALWVVGPQVEKLYGGARFLILYVMTGVAGVLGSYWRHPESVSAGASGAIFGLFGALLVFGFKYRNSIPPFFQKAVGRGVLPVILINLVIGFSIPGIDNSAHIGGLLAGAALAAIIPYDKPSPGVSDSQGGPNALFQLVQLILILVIAASFYEVAVHYDGPSLSFRNVSRSWTHLWGNDSSRAEFIDTINNAQQAISDSIDQLSAVSPLAQAPPSGLARSEAELTRTIDQLNRVPSLARRADETIDALRELAQSQYALVEDIERNGSMTFDHFRRVKVNEDRYKDVVESFNRWVETEGGRYGIQLRKRS